MTMGNWSADEIPTPPGMTAPMVVPRELPAGVLMMAAAVLPDGFDMDECFTRLGGVPAMMQLNFDGPPPLIAATARQMAATLIAAAADIEDQHRRQN